MGGSQMEMLRIENFDDLEANKWGIRQPSFQKQFEDLFQIGKLDFVITPGLSFDKSGNRLGHGKGYYDKFFHKCFQELKQNHQPYLVGLALNEQIMPIIPVEEFDVKMNLVISPDF